MNFYALAAAIVIAALIVVYFRRGRMETGHWAYPLLLATFPAYYWVFAVHGSDYAALKYELVAGALFIALAYGAFRLNQFAAVLVLAVAYMAHAIYDFTHNLLFVNSGAPLWWPEFCGTIDGLIGVYLLFLAIKLKSAKISAA